MIRSDHCSDEMKERIEGEYPMKKWIGRMAVLLAFVLTLSGSTLAAFGKIPSATKEFYVNDYAGVFSDTWKEELCKAGEQLYRRCIPSTPSHATSSCSVSSPAACRS